MTDDGDSCVHVFSEHGEDILQLTEMQEYDSSIYTAFHWPSEHVVVAGLRPRTKDLLLLIYTKDGEFVRRIEHSVEGIRFLEGLTVTVEGRIGVLAMLRSGSESSYFKVLVL